MLKVEAKHLKRQRTEIFTKYLQASDLIEQQIAIDVAEKNFPGGLAQIIHAVLPFLNFEMTSN